MKKYILTVVLIVLVSLTVFVMLEMDKERERKNEQAKKAEPALTSDKIAHYLTSANDSIAFATGFFTKEKAAAVGKADPLTFAGKYYNSGLGYIFTIENPEKYGLTYDRRHKKTSDYPATLVRAGDSIVFEVTKAELHELLDIETYLNTYLLAALYDDKPKPKVSYDYTSQMGFFKGFHQYYGEDILTKVYMDSMTAYVAMLRFPKRLSKDIRVKELSKAVTSFSLIK